MDGTIDGDMMKRVQALLAMESVIKEEFGGVSADNLRELLRNMKTGIHIDPVDSSYSSSYEKLQSLLNDLNCDTVEEAKAEIKSYEIMFDVLSSNGLDDVGRLREDLDSLVTRDEALSNIESMISDQFLNVRTPAETENAIARLLVIRAEYEEALDEMEEGIETIKDSWNGVMSEASDLVTIIQGRKKELQ
jgi:hypothetical protein